jgi:hypothetical protein
MTIYVKKSGTWQKVPRPFVKESDTFVPILGGWTKKDGVWQRIYPGPVTASIALVGGGGGGGPTGWNEGGGGGGAGGVVPFKTVTLDTGSTYNVVVGAGGAQRNNGGYSNLSGGTFGSGDVFTANSASIPIYAGTYPAYCSFLNTYGVWTTPDFVNPVGSWVSVSYTSYNPLPSSQYVTMTCSADNHVRVFINGVFVGSSDTFQSTNSFSTYLQPGNNTILVQSLNDGGPALFAATLMSNIGQLLWSTQSPLTITDLVTGFTAYGGGAGAYSTTTGFTGGNGASGGGGTGCGDPHGGGSSIYPGQGTSGGTGPHQSNGGGGGGYLGAGYQAGDGGAGVNLISPYGWSRSVGGGGGGGASYYGYTIGGAGGIGGGGNGANARGANAQDGLAGTGGGGGGGCSVTNGGNGTSGGCGLVIVQYQSSFALFSGGAISINNNVVTHLYEAGGAYTLVPLTG